MRFRILVLLMLLGVATAAPAQISIGINFSLFPELVRVPDYPVYYAPRQNANYFFYDGFYWVFQDDEWYSSDWYNGPWYRVAPEYVPVYVLRVPVRYYRRPPQYFGGWQRDAPPRWGEHWGREWEQRRSGWDQWNRRSAPAPAPVPTYQRQYSGNKYPKVEQQEALRDQKYRYQPKDALVREHVQPQMREARAPAARQQAEPQRKDSGKDAREREQKSQPPAVTPRKQEPTPRKQEATPREQQPRPQPQAAPPREQQPRPQAAPQREQQPKPKPQAAPQREPQRQENAPGKGNAREQGGEQRQGQDKGQERSRGKGEDNK